MVEYEKDAIVNPSVTEYIRSELKKNDGILAELEAYAAEHDVPIILPETAQLIKNISMIKRPSDILEVGCAIGYSSTLLAGTLADGGHITTIEYDPDMVRMARSNIKRAGFENTITVVEADARDYLPYIEEDERFDFIFLDGPKAHYVYMLDECVRLLKHGGVLIADNVLYKGMTADDELVIRRKITIVKRLRAFIDALSAHKELETSVLPVGDGMTFSVKL